MKRFRISDFGFRNEKGGRRRAEGGMNQLRISPFDFFIYLCQVIHKSQNKYFYEQILLSHSDPICNIG